MDIILSQRRIAETAAAGLWPDRLITDYLDEAAAAYPDKPAIIEYRQAPGEAPGEATGQTTRVSFAELLGAADRFALALARAGIGPGDVVSFQMPNWWQFSALHLACVRIGAVTNPLMPIYRHRELRFMLEVAQTKLLVVPNNFRGFDYPAMIADLRDDLPALKHLFVIDGRGEDSFAAYFEDRAGERETDAAALFAARRPNPNQPTELLYTSGTTGEPKGVIHTHNTLLSVMGQHIELIGLGADDVILQFAPVAHQAGFLHGVLVSVMLGATMVLQDVWDPDQAARLIATHRATYAMGATPFLADLTDCDGAGTCDLSSFKTFVTAGAPIPRSLVPRAIERLGVNVIASWGMTEFGTVTTTRPGDAEEKIFGTDGAPVPGIEARIVDQDDRLLPPGEEGCFQVRGMSKFVGYVKRPDLYGADPDGWFDTGDLARMDEDGYIRITGRSKDVIIRGGQNIPVVEVENELYRHPAVRQVAIAAMPDPRLGERACAFVILEPGADLDFAGMTDFLLGNGMAKSYLPERLEIIEELPLTPSGKVQKFKLRALAAKFDESGLGEAVMHGTGARLEEV